MKTIDRTLKYVDLYLVNNDLDNIKEYQLPKGYKFVSFTDGDEKYWVEIELSSGEFLTKQEGEQEFQEYYANHYKELKERCIFIENEQGEKVATATAFYLESPIDDITGDFHWLAIKKEYQGKHLSKPLIREALKKMRKLGHKKTILHTQTHTWLAVKLYLDMGFEPYKIKESYIGWQIIKKLTNHEKLSNISDIEISDMYNPLYIQTYEFLKNKFKEPFIYKIYDEQIGINDNGQVHYYKYNFEEEKLKIVGEINEYNRR